METKEMIVNRPLANTYGWLHVNGTKISQPDSVETADFSLKAGEERTVVVENTGKALYTTAELSENATLRLVQLWRGGAGERLINDVNVRCGENARFEYYRLILGGGETFDNCAVTLEGDGSSFGCEIGYRLGGDEKLDMNLSAIHTGRKTTSHINASGVLRCRSFKLFRGTIDLRRGCAGAVGDEVEDVLLMDETVRNQTVPVILCAEEDVVGNHGATIGRIDESVVFYLQSRGLTREAIYEMMAQAKLNAVITKIPEAKLRCDLLTDLRGEGKT